MSDTPLKIAIVAGEESGDLLGADLIAALARKQRRTIKLIGVGGRHLEALGLKSLFASEEISLMGLGAVLKKIAKLIKYINQLARYIAQEQPDCLIIIDSPEFTHRVAKKLKKIAPNIPIIKYIAPTVWAWRPERAKEMAAYIDHVLVVFPFEEQVMHVLEGPKATYVGHRLLNYAPLLALETARKSNFDIHSQNQNILLLPGSRRMEIRALLPIFCKVIDILKSRQKNTQFILPTLPHLVDEINALLKDSTTPVQVVVGEEEKWQSFVGAKAALAASGTVLLELALANIPMVSCYKADNFSKLFLAHKITTWSAALPNIIADSPVVPEYFNEFLRPGMLARQLEQLLHDGPTRQVQIDGFKRVRDLMKITTPSGDLAADIILKYINQK